MRSNTELSKRLDELEALSGSKAADMAERIKRLEDSSESWLNDMADKLVEKCKLKLLKSDPNLAAMNAKLADFATSLSIMETLVDKVKAENASLIIANKALKAQNETLTKKVSEVEQYSRVNNIELKGIPCTQGENCADIIKAIGAKISCPIVDTDLDIVHRVPVRAEGRTPNLIARFCSRSKKQEFLSKARKARLNTKDLNFSGTESYPVYANDHLTPENKRLFAKALALKKETEWKFLWTDNGRIKARQWDDSRVFRIETEADLSVFR